MVTALTANGVMVFLLGRRRGWPAVTMAAAGAAPAILGLAVIWRTAWPLVGSLAAAPAPAAREQGGSWSAPNLRPAEGTLLVNVAEAAATGRARITSPGGASIGAGRHVEVRQLTVNDGDPDRGAAATSRRQWLYLHPPSSVSVEVALPAGRTVWFQSTLALDPQVWGVDVGDGARYLVSVAPLDRQGRPGASETVLDTTVNPRAQGAHRRWLPVEADLSRWAGRVVRVSLSTEHLGDVNYDWSGWGQPVVTVRETDRVRPLAAQPLPDWAPGRG